MSNSEAIELQSFLMNKRVQADLMDAAKGLVKPADLVRLAILANSTQPDIARCTKASIIRALTHAASLDIEPSGLMGRGYLIPRRGRSGLELHFDPGYRGLMDVAMRSGLYKMFVANPVFENDEYDFDYRSEKIVPYHRPAKKDRGALICAYAVVDFRAGGQSKGEQVGIEDIAKVKATSAMKGGGPWAQWEERMAMKTAVRRLCMQLTYDPKVQEAMKLALEVDLDEEDDQPKPPAGDRAATRIARARAVQVSETLDVSAEPEAKSETTTEAEPVANDDLPFGDGESLQ